MLDAKDFVPVEGFPARWVNPKTGHILVGRVGQTLEQFIIEINAAEQEDLNSAPLEK